MIKQLLFYLKVSRPGLWFATIWLYLLPTSQMNEILSSPAFWYGLFYVCFPLNFMVYGWNDMVDIETDAHNKRKDSFWFGARGSKDQLAGLWKPILITQLLFYTPMIYWGGWKMILLFMGFLLINGLYNLPTNGLRAFPPLELFCQVGYLLIAPLSILVNETLILPIWTFIYLFLFAIQSHLIGEVMDIEPDKKAGRKTTATLLGVQKTKLLIIFIVSLEVAILLFVFNEFYFGLFLGLALVWLLIDLFIIYKTQIYSLGQMKFFALMSNFSALGSMAYVWHSGCLLN